MPYFVYLQTPRVEASIYYQRELSRNESCNRDNRNKAARANGVCS